jgi:CRP-like cAMP-binding protein
MDSQKQDLIHHPRVQSVLESSPLLLRKFPPDDFREFLLCGKLEEYNAGETIVSEKDHFVNDGWLLVDGSVSLFKEDVYIAKLQPGDFVGETFLFKNRAPSGTLIATRPSAIIRFKRKDVLNFFENRPDRLFKIFIMNLIDLQNQKLIYAGKKLLYIQRKLAYQSNEDN